MRDTLIKFILLREDMRRSRELIGGPGPHSPDPILAASRFCNINREHDGVTRYIHKHFRLPFYSAGVDFMVGQMMFCRIFNEPATLAVCCPLKMDGRDVLGVPQFKGASAKLKAYRDAGNKLMRGAYMMPPHGKHAAGQDLVDHQLENIGLALCHEYEELKTLQGVANCLMTVCGIGPFVANQICTDLRYVPQWGRKWEDWSTFILCGQGTRRGVNRLDGKPLTAGGSDATYTQRILDIREDLRPDLPEEVNHYYIDPNNLSNTFCEFDKYVRGHEQLLAGKEVTLRRYTVTA